MTLEEFIKLQKPIDAEIYKILDDNRWDLYDHV